MSQNCTDSMIFACNSDRWYAWKQFLEVCGYVETIGVAFVTLCTVIAVVMAFFYAFKTHRQLSQVKKTRVNKLWFQNIAVCQKRFTITTAKRMETLEEDAKKMVTENAENVLWNAIELLNKKDFFEENSVDESNFNPPISRIIIQNLVCQPDPGKFSILSLRSFPYHYVDITCYASKYHFVYYYDYSHRKPILQRLKTSESQFDFVCNHLKSHHIISQLADEAEPVCLGPETEGITLQVLLLAIHMTYLIPPRNRQLNRVLKLFHREPPTIKLEKAFQIVEDAWKTLSKRVETSNGIELGNVHHFSQLDNHMQ